jgi:hypothetical protein
MITFTLSFFFVVILFVVSLWFTHALRLIQAERIRERNFYSERKIEFEKRVKSIQDEYTSQISHLEDRRDLEIERLQNERDEWRDRAMIRNNYTAIKPENRPSSVTAADAILPVRAAQQHAASRFRDHDMPEVEYESAAITENG